MTKCPRRARRVAGQFMVWRNRICGARAVVRRNVAQEERRKMILRRLKIRPGPATPRWPRGREKELSRIRQLLKYPKKTSPRE